mgnify:CR=1 FL=1|jgi:hypothetical protein
MYEFILNMWIMGRIDEDYLNKAVDKNRITAEERRMIIATPKLNSI